MSHTAPTLAHVCDVVVYVDNPVEAGLVQGLQTHGLRRIIPIVSGTVAGRINGRVLAGGADFQMVVGDTVAISFYEVL